MKLIGTMICVSIIHLPTRCGELVRCDRMERFQQATCEVLHQNKIKTRLSPFRIFRCHRFISLDVSDSPPPPGSKKSKCRSEEALLPEKNGLTNVSSLSVVFLGKGALLKLLTSS